MIGQLKVCQHNVAKGITITQSLFEVSLREKCDFLFLQEPYIYFNTAAQGFATLSHPAYHCILPPSSVSQRPRLVAYVSKSSPYDITARTDLISDSDMQLFEVTTSSERFFIIHIYNEKSTVAGVSHTTLQRLYETNLQVEMPFLLLGDLNLHHVKLRNYIQQSVRIIFAKF